MAWIDLESDLELFFKEAAFKSKAQRRYFYWKNSKGDPDFSKKVISEFESKTPKTIPEKVKK
jgi:hypothetical protein